MKRNIKFFIILALVLLFSSLSVLPASAASECVSPDPSYRTCDCGDGGSWNGVEYYERGDGYTVYIDVCNDCFTEYTYKVWDSHDYQEQTVNGVLYNVCQNCGTGYRIEDCTHEFETSVVPPNCEERGYTWYECSLCDYAYQDDWVEKTDHSYVYVMTVEPTCTKSGYVYYTCEHCGVPPSAEVGYTPPLGHDWVTVSSEVGEDNKITVKSECTACHVTKSEVFESAAAQAQNWLLTSIRGTSTGLIDMYEVLANGIEIGGITLGEVITAALIVLAIVILLALVFKILG